MSQIAPADAQVEPPEQGFGPSSVDAVDRERSEAVGGVVLGSHARA